MASGGLDSTVLAYWLDARDIRYHILFLDYGQHCAQTELDTLQRVLPRDSKSCIHVASIGSLLRNSPSRLIREADLWHDQITAESLIIPYRNLLLLSAGAAFAASVGATALYAAFINSNHATEIDATKDFLDNLTVLFSAVGAVSVFMPFREMSKSEVALIGIELNAPVGLTYSCQASSTEHCGACPNCVDRTAALQSASYFEATGSRTSVAQSR